MDDMDGLCHGKSYTQVDDLGIPLFWETRTIVRIMSL